MELEAGVTTCLGFSSTPGSSLEGSLVLFGVHLEQETASTNTLNAVFPRGQGRMENRKDLALPSLLPASWVLKKGALLQ